MSDLFKSNYEQEMGNFMNMLLNPGLGKALDNMTKNTKDFFSNGGGIISFSCPVCGNKINFDAYNKNTDSIKDNGVLYCNKCDHYIGFTLVNPSGNSTSILLKAYDKYEDTSVIEDFDKYLADNVSIDDWKIIFANTDFSSYNSIQLKRIKNILEARGVVFEEENNNKEGE